MIQAYFCAYDKGSEFYQRRTFKGLKQWFCMFLANLFEKLAAVFQKLHCSLFDFC